MKISVVISAHKDDAFILTLRALQNQTYKPYQIIISDNANGNFRQIAKDFNCDYIYSEIPSRAIARNKGFSLVKGDITLFLDEDIVPTIKCLELINDFFSKEENKNRTLNGNVNEFILTTDFKDIPDEAFNRIINIETQNNYFKAKYWRVPSNCFCCLTKLLKKEKVLFDENFKGYGEEDCELFYRLYQKGVRMFYCFGALAFHRRHLIPYKTHIEEVKKNVIYFLEKHNYSPEIIQVSEKVWKDCYGINKPISAII